MRMRHFFLASGLIFLVFSALVILVVHITSDSPGYMEADIDMPIVSPEPEPYVYDYEDIVNVNIPYSTPYPEDIIEEPPLQNLRTITRPMPLFANKYDSGYLSIIPPQAVEVLEDADGWLLINTYYGPKWINLDFTPQADALDEFFARFGTNLGIYYKNLDTGFIYSFNPDRVFFGASVNKAIHGFYTYIAAERGYIDMNATHTFRSDDFWGGSGIIRFMPPGTAFTTRELLYHSIVHSDNIAFRMLANYMYNIGFSYHDFIREIGANPRFVLDRYTANASVYDSGLWLSAIYNYLESETRYGHYFHKDLHNTAVYSHPYFSRGQVFGGSENINVQFIHSDYPVAQKYGWGISAFHVMGIVDAPSPFILVIFSNMENGAHELFEEISWLMQEFNDKYFVGLAN